MADLGWTAGLAEDFAKLLEPGLRPGRVSRSDRGLSTVLMPAPVRVRNGSQSMTTGDWVAVAPAAPGQALRQVAAVLPRRSAFVRLRAASDEPQVVAANLDVVLLAAALDREVNLRTLERYLTMAWDSGATPVVVLTKADSRSQVDVVSAIQDTRRVAVGVEVVAVSARTGFGMGPLATRFLRPGLTAGVVGASGAGKSTLVNSLMGTEAMATGAVRSDGKGRHTTSHRQLLLLPGRGILIDTPGLRSLGLWLSTDGVDRTFADLAELARRCRFNDCSHTQEPGCRILAAIAAGELLPARVEAWRKLGREAESVAARQGDLALQRAQRQLWKARAREQRPRPSG